MPFGSRSLPSSRLTAFIVHSNITKSPGGLKDPVVLEIFINS